MNWLIRFSVSHSLCPSFRIKVIREINDDARAIQVSVVRCMAFVVRLSTLSPATAHGIEDGRTSHRLLLTASGSMDSPCRQ